jgi:chaperone modulatory protein CbpM
VNVVQGDARAWLELEELCALVAAPPEWIAERVQAGLVEVGLDAPGEPAQGWRFDSLVVARLRSMRRTELCYGAVPELAALVADLEEEVARLRAQLFALRR